MNIAIIGAGLAGCEAAYFLLKNELPVTLFEMKPARFSEAHSLPGFAELVCSNSLKTLNSLHPSGMLKAEIEQLGSIMMSAARETRVPAGEALSVDRKLFSELITTKISALPGLTIRTGEVARLPEGFDVCIIATGPLTSASLSDQIAGLVGSSFLYFYDAIAPIIDAESIDRTLVFAGSRHGRGGDDYLNIPLSKEQYLSFVEEIRNAEKVVLRPFEKELFYEGCLPVEVLASRGADTLAYGPMKPIGFTRSDAGFEPYAVIQLRREDREGTSYNMVGFQTKMTYREQERIFRKLPGLEHAEFLRYGSIHRNTYIDAPRLLSAGLNLREHPDIYFAGQITGVEGYVESAAIGLLCGLSVFYKVKGIEPLMPPGKTALGALLRHLTNSGASFQPSGIHMGLFERERLPKKTDKRQYLFDQERKAFAEWIEGLRGLGIQPVTD